MFKGVFLSDSGEAGNRKGDFANSYAELFPNGTAPLLAFSSGMGKVQMGDISKVWFEEAKLSHRARVSPAGGGNSSAVSITVVDSGNLVPNQVLLVEATGERIFVSGVSGNVLTIIRGIGQTTPASIANDAYLSIIGTAFPENSNRPQTVNNLGKSVSNFAQIFRNSWSTSGTVKALEYYTGNKVQKTRRDCMMFHAEQIERALIWGKREVLFTGGETVRMMGGLDDFIQTNVEAQGSDLSWAEIVSFFETIFSKNIKGMPNERIGFCGNSVIRVINEIAQNLSHIELKTGQAEFGWEISYLITPFGKITLKTHPLMVEHPVWTKDLWVLHPGAMKILSLRETFVEDTLNGKATRNGVDGDQGDIITEMSMMYMCEETAGKFTGIDTAAAA